MRPPGFSPRIFVAPPATITHSGDLLCLPSAPPQLLYEPQGPCYGIHIDAFLQDRLDICCMHSGYAAQRAAGAEDYMGDDRDHSTGTHHHHRLDDGPLRRQRSLQHVTRTHPFQEGPISRITPSAHFFHFPHFALHSSRTRLSIKATRFTLHQIQILCEHRRY